jgi:hypothetical protein
MPNISDYYVDRITLLFFKEQIICRKDIFKITQSLIDSTIYMNKDLKMLPNPDNDESPIGQISSFKGTKAKLPLTGLVTSSTDFQLRSLSSGIYFLVEVSKDSYDFSFSSKTKFELIIEYLKNTVNKLKESNCSHCINIIFFTRIYFNKDINRKILKSRTKSKYYKCLYSENIGDFIYQSNLFSGEYFFDVYSNVIKSNLNKLDAIEMVNSLYRAFNTFATIFKVRNLSDYMKELKNNFDVNFVNYQTNISGMNNNNTINRNNSESSYYDNFNFKETSFQTKSNIQQFYNFFSPKFFEDIENFRMTKSITSNMFESVNVLLNELKYEKRKLFKLGNIINLISSGEYFPYYNYRLSKITKENLLEQGIPFFITLLSNKSKTTEIYRKDSHQINHFERDDSNIVNTYSASTYERGDRKQSSYSRKATMNENDIRLTIAKNYDILDNLNDRLVRKNSIDQVHKDSTLTISYYRNEADIFTHVTPKWIKLFFVTNYSISKVKTPNFSLNSENNYCSHLSHQHHNINYSNVFNQAFNTSSTSLNFKAARKMSLSQQETVITLPENIDNDIFNSKKKSDPSLILKSENKQEIIEDDEYKDLAISKKFNLTFCGKSKFFCKDQKESDGFKMINSLESSQVFNLQSLKQKLSIYKPVYEKSKSNKKEEKENKYNTNLDVSNFTHTGTTYKLNLSENSKAKEYKELLKKANEYENEIFCKKFSRSNSFSKVRGVAEKAENKEIKEIKSKSRDTLHSFEFFDNSDDYAMIVELLTQVPLLPIFGEFNPDEMKEDVRMSPHYLGSLNNDCSILEEIVFERLNNNYQIVKPKAHSEVYNKIYDLKNISSIQLFDRSFYHMILVEDLNYKVQIYNYSNKINKYAYNMNSGNTQSKDDSIRLSSMESDFNYLDYNFLVYDKKVKFLTGKRLNTKLGEKNEVFWQKYDIWLNDMQLNIKQIKFKNEMNFLILDKFEDFARKKKTGRIINSQKDLFNNANDGLNSLRPRSPKEESNGNQNFSQTSSPNYFSNKMHYTENNLLLTKHKNNPVSELSNNSLRENLSPQEHNLIENQESIKERLKIFVSSIDSYLSKYPKFNDKMTEKISYCEIKSFQKNKNNLIFYVLFLNHGTDWLLLVFNEIFNEKNALFLSLRWLSCNSMPILNLHKELIKKSRIKNLALLKIPCDEIIFSSFKRICNWKICPTSKLNILDRIFSEGILSNFIRSELDGNYVYYNEDLNLFVKISQKVSIFINFLFLGICIFTRRSSGMQ